MTIEIVPLVTAILDAGCCFMDVLRQEDRTVRRIISLYLGEQRQVFEVV